MFFFKIMFSWSCNLKAELSGLLLMEGDGRIRKQLVNCGSQSSEDSMACDEGNVRRLPLQLKPSSCERERTRGWRGRLGDECPQ